MKRISLGSDHAGWKLKQTIKEYLHQKIDLEKVENQKLPKWRDFIMMQMY